MSHIIFDRTRQTTTLYANCLLANWMKLLQLHTTEWPKVKDSSICFLIFESLLSSGIITIKKYTFVFSHMVVHFLILCIFWAKSFDFGKDRTCIPSIALLRNSHLSKSIQQMRQQISVKNFGFEYFSFIWNIILTVSWWAFTERKWRTTFFFSIELWQSNAKGGSSLNHYPNSISYYRITSPPKKETDDTSVIEWGKEKDHAPFLSIDLRQGDADTGFWHPWVGVSGSCLAWCPCEGIEFELK